MSGDVKVIWTVTVDGDDELVLEREELLELCSTLEDHVAAELITHEGTWSIDCTYVREH